MSELFPVESMLSPSPRLLWLREHNLALGELPDGKKFCVGEHATGFGNTHLEAEQDYCAVTALTHWEVHGIPKGRRHHAGCGGGGGVVRTSRTAKQAAFVFGQQMKPCPKCGSFNMFWQTPINMKEEILETDSAKQMVGKWARAIKDGCTPLEGPVFLMCRDCYHKGPAMDCSGRTSEEVGRDKEVADTVKQLWNTQ